MYFVASIAKDTIVFIAEITIANITNATNVLLDIPTIFAFKKDIYINIVVVFVC